MAVIFVVLCLVVICLNRPEAGRLADAHPYLIEQRRSLGKISRAEGSSLIAFAAAITGWVGPSVVGLVIGKDSSITIALSGRLDEGAVALLAAVLLFLLPVNWQTRELTMTWERRQESTGGPSCWSVRGSSSGI
ncbi:hypothetical protein [Streptomyces malaysiensis]|uniref:hypothetical protein n=1 Tax=Streptomyces malaysiensis TaxID=92644 RepID=UPI0028C4DE0C|nr:hypothetical protein [Streptomyces malaysiensis]